MHRAASSTVRSLLAAAIVAAAVSCSSPAHAQAPFKVEQRWKIGGEGSWDYMTVDPVAHRLYIAHLTRVEVVDLTTGKAIGAIEGLKHCHDILIAPDGFFGYISDGGANSIVLFDTTTLAKIDKIRVETNPDGITYEPTTRTLWAFNGGSKSVSVIDVDERRVIATLDMPGKPEFPVTDGDGTVYVNVEDNNSIVRIDASTRRITATWKLAGCDSPSGLAIDKSGQRLFSVCDGNRMAITSARTGKSLGTPHIGEGPDATAFDAARGLVFASNEDGTLSIISTRKPGYPVVQLLPTMNGARTMALDESTGKIYTVSAMLGAVPPPAPGVHHNRPAAIPGSFTVLVIGNDSE